MLDLTRSELFSMYHSEYAKLRSKLLTQLRRCTEHQRDLRSHTNNPITMPMFTLSAMLQRSLRAQLLGDLGIKDD